LDHPVCILGSHDSINRLLVISLHLMLVAVYTYGNSGQSNENESEKCSLKCVGYDGAATFAVNSQPHRRIVTVAIVYLEQVFMDARSFGIDIATAERHALRVERTVLYLSVNSRECERSGKQS